jgi:hypothetical protein
MTIDKIVKEIRKRSMCEWELSNEAAQKLILDLIREERRKELKYCKQYHQCGEDV